MENARQIELIEQTLKPSGIYRFLYAREERGSLINRVKQLGNGFCISLGLRGNEILYIKENKEKFMNYLMVFKDLFNSNFGENYKHIAFCNLVENGISFPHTIVVYTDKTRLNSTGYIERGEIILNKKPEKQPEQELSKEFEKNDMSYKGAIRRLAEEKKISIRNIKKVFKVNQKVSKRIYDYLHSFVCLFEINPDNRNEKIYHIEQVETIEFEFLEKIIKLKI